MTTEIKEYKELVEIETFSGNLYTPANIEDVDKMMQNKFIVIGDERVAVHQIKGYKPKRVHGIESHILSKTKEDQKLLEQRLKEKMERIGRGWDSIEEIENYLLYKNSGGKL